MKESGILCGMICAILILALLAALVATDPDSTGSEPPGM